MFKFVERCDSVVNNDPRNYFAAVQRVYYMLRANSWDSSPRYPAEVVVQAIQVAEELLEAATNRVQAAYVAQRVVFEDNLRRSGEGQTELSSSFKVDDILSRRAPSLLAKIPPKHHSVGSIQASTKLVTPAVNTNQLNPRPVQPKVHRDTHISTGPTAAPVAETATGAGAVAGAEDNSEAAASNGERTQDHHQQQTRIEKIPGLETIVELRRRMMKLKETVHGASDIRYVDAELDSLNAQDRATDAEAYCEGLTGYPKPVLRNKPQPKRRGSWWPILIGVICGCVGGWLVAGATLGSGAFLGGSMLIGSGISDILLGVQSLSSGQPVKFGQWIQGKTKVIASAVALWISKMSPELAASRAAAVTREAAVHVTLPDGINVRDGNLHGVPEAMARATAAAPPMETRQIYRVLDPPVTAKHSARDTPRAGKQQVPATSGTSGPTPAAAVAPSTSTSTSSAFTFSAPAASTLSSPAPSVDNHFNRPDVFADLERCLGDIAAHLESSMPEEIELRAALRPYRVEIEALLMQRPVLLRLASVYAFAGNHLSSYLGEVFAKILDGNHHTEDSQDKCRMCWYGAVPQVVSNGSGLLPILYKRADSNLADVLCSEELQDAIIHDIRYEGVCGVYGDTYGDLLYSALLADIEYTTKPKPSISIDEFKANIEALVNAGKLENDWLTIKSAPATAAAPIAQGKASARPMPTGAILRKSASATPHLQPRRPLSPEAFFRSVTEGSSRFLADYVYPESAAFLVEVATTLLTKAIQDKHCKVLRDEYNKARGGEIEPISEDSIEALLAPFQTLLRAALLDAHVYGSEELSTVNTDETDDSSADKTRLQQLVRLVAIAIHHSPGYKETVRSMFKRFFLSVTKDHNGDKTVKYRLPWSVAVPVLSTSRRYLPIAPELATELVSVFMRELCQQELMTLLELKNLGRSAAYVVYQNEAVSRYPSALAGSLLDEQLLYVDQAAFEKCAFQLGGRLLLDRITLIDTAVLSNATLPPTLSFSSSVFGPTAVAAGPPSPPSPLATSNAAADATADDVSKLPAGTHPEVERFLREVTLHTSPFMAVAEGVALTLLTELTITALVKCIQQKQEEKLTRYYS